MAGKWVPWVIGGIGVTGLVALVVSAAPKKELVKDDALRRKAVQLAYPDRDTGGWDIWAYDPKVGAIYDELVKAKT